MILYVESNFVLELELAQEESQEAGAILICQRERPFSRGRGVGEDGRLYRGRAAQGAG